MSFYINESVHTLLIEYLFRKTCHSQKADLLSMLMKAFITSLFRKKKQILKTSLTYVIKCLMQ